MRRLALVALAVAAASCGSSPTTPSPVPQRTLTISGLERYTTPLAPNMKVQLVSTLTAVDGSKQDCSAIAAWSSSNDTVLRLTGASPGEFLIVNPGDVNVSAVCAGVTGTLPVHIDKPTSWPVSGRVLAGPGGDPVPGATLTFGSLPAISTSASGEYTIVTPDASVQRLVVTAPGFQTRETYLRGGTLRTLDIDLLGGDLLTLYRNMARNAHEAPQSLHVAPTRRWTQNPNIYIWTTWKDSGQPVANVEFYVQQIRRVIPQLTGGTLQAGTIEHGPDERPLTPGWIKVQFHRSGNWGVLGGNPGNVQFASDHACNHIAITHELGHAMGFWHSGRPNTIMGSMPAFCRDADLTPDEARVAKAMYGRAPGNVEPDRDPNPSWALLSAKGSEQVRVSCPHIR